jgi:hypothetical protein
MNIYLVECDPIQVIPIFISVNRRSVVIAADPAAAELCVISQTVRMLFRVTTLLLGRAEHHLGRSGLVITEAFPESPSLFWHKVPRPTQDEPQHNPEGSDE